MPKKTMRTINYHVKLGYKKSHAVAVFMAWANGVETDEESGGILNDPSLQLKVYYWGQHQNHERSMLYDRYTEAYAHAPQSQRGQITKLYRQMCELCRESPHWDISDYRVDARSKRKLPL